MFFYITTIILALSTVSNAADTTTRKPLCNSCVLVANALKNANKLPNVKTGMKKICNNILRNDLTCNNVINAASLYLTLTPANTLCAEVHLCTASSSLIPGLPIAIPTGLPIHLPTALPIPIPNIDLPIHLPTAHPIPIPNIDLPIHLPTALPIPIPNIDLPIPSLSIPAALPKANDLTSGVVGALGKATGGLTNSLTNGLANPLTRRTRNSDFGFTNEQLQAAKVITDFINGQLH